MQIEIPPYFTLYRSTYTRTQSLDMAELPEGNNYVYRDIEVQVFNETEDDNIIVLVFARRYPIPLTTETMRMAWRLLKIPPKGNIKFMFPLKNSIGAFHYDKENHVSSETFEAEPGSTWIAKTQQNGQITLEQVGVFHKYIFYTVFSVFIVEAF